jgi:hypothetical protein
MDLSIVEKMLAKHPQPPKYDDDGNFLAEFDEPEDVQQPILLDQKNKKIVKSEEEEEKDEEIREWGLIPTMMRLLVWY